MRTLALGLAWVAVVGCEGTPSSGAGASARLGSGAMQAAYVASSDAAAAIAASAEHCKTEIAKVLTRRGLPGAPRLEGVRAELLARAKAEPVLFVDTPEAEASVPLEAQILRQELAQSIPAGPALSRIAKATENRPELLRQILLRDGYFYADDPELASALVESTELQRLFDAPEVQIERGSEVFRAVRGEKGKYVYSSGPEAGKRARLILFDRVSAADAPHKPPLHLDVRRLSERLGFERWKTVHLTDSAVVAELRYGELWIQTLLDRHGAELERACEVVPRELSGRVAEARARAQRHAEVMRVKRRAMLEQVEESLPFDEPKTEDGQQDGNLRPAWIWAYTHGWDSYQFNDDRYPVFDARGRPRVPQVCVDFIMDTLERASGTHWRERGAERARTKGQLDFNDLGVGNRRSVDRFVEFAESHPAWFDVYRLLPEERVPFAMRARFFQHLAENADRYVPGDVVVIHGLRADNEMHFHSFFVYDADPVSGMPTLVAANAGRPRIRPWESEMRSAPRRSIRMRVRPRLEWLESILPVAKSVSSTEPASSSTTG